MILMTEQRRKPLRDRDSVMNWYITNSTGQSIVRSSHSAS